MKKDTWGLWEALRRMKGEEEEDHDDDEKST